MSQGELFYEDFRGAFAHAIKCLGGCAAVGKELWPALTAKQAEGKLADSLNPDRNSKLSFEEVVQVLRVARDRGIHCAINQLNRELDYAEAALVTPKSEREVIGERMSRALAEVQRHAAELAAIERKEGMAQIRAVSDRR